MVIAAHGDANLEPVHPGRKPFGAANPIFVTPQLLRKRDQVGGTQRARVEPHVSDLAEYPIVHDGVIAVAPDHERIAGVLRRRTSERMNAHAIEIPRRKPSYVPAM